MSERDQRIMRPHWSNDQKPVWTQKYLEKMGINHNEFVKQHGGKEKVYADLAVMTVEDFETAYGLR